MAVVLSRINYPLNDVTPLLPHPISLFYLYIAHRRPARCANAAERIVPPTSSLPLLLLFTIDIITIMITFLYLFLIHCVPSLPLNRRFKK